LAVEPRSTQIQQFVTSLFALNRDISAFKSTLRDFLISLKVPWPYQLLQ